MGVCPLWHQQMGMFFRHTFRFQSSDMYPQTLCVGKKGIKASPMTKSCLFLGQCYIQSWNVGGTRICRLWLLDVLTVRVDRQFEKPNRRANILLVCTYIINRVKSHKTFANKVFFLLKLYLTWLLLCHGSISQFSLIMATHSLFTPYQR